jgi:Tol biopolymer transport system component
MRRQLLLTLLTAAALCLSAADRPREVQLQQALDLMQTKGDLRGAIKLLEEVSKSTDRNLAARSLLYLGDCRHKLGQQEASKPYDRVIRDFADQREVVAEAQARLAAMKQPVPVRSGIITRQVWTGPRVDTSGTVSPDGRHLSFTDWTKAELGLHDLTTGEDRRLTASENAPGRYEFPEESTISRDGKQVAYAWFGVDNRYELRLRDLSAEPEATPRILFSKVEVEWVAPYDWTPDGKSLAVQLIRADRTAQIGLISVADGALRVLKSVDWRGASNLLFSPDGKYLAYDLPVSDNSPQRDVFVMATDASKETPVLANAADETVLGWSPDGKHLLIASNRGGSYGLWAMAIGSGKGEGTPILIKADIGRARGMGLNRSGTLYLGMGVGAQDIHVAAVDLKTGTLLSAPAGPIQQFLGANAAPVFSPDGRQMAFHSSRSGRRDTLVVLTLETGQVREHRPDLAYFNHMSWAPDGRRIIVTGSDSKGRNGVYGVDTQTGALSPLLAGAGMLRPTLSPDGKTLYYRKIKQGADAVIMAHDLASGTDREIFKNAIQPRLSPDGRQFVLTGNPRGVLTLVSLDNGKS